MTESLIDKLEAVKPGNIDSVFSRGFEQCRAKCITIIRQHQSAQDELVERVARLLCKKDGYNPDCESEEGYFGWHDYVKNAQNIIAAINMGDVNDKHVVEMPEAIEKHDIHSEICLPFEKYREEKGKWMLANQRLALDSDFTEKAEKHAWDVTHKKVRDDSWKIGDMVGTIIADAYDPEYLDPKNNAEVLKKLRRYLRATEPKPVAAGESSDTDGEMAKGALEAIHALLDDGGVPRGTFADDHVRNLVVLYNQRGDRIAELETTRKPVIGDAKRLKTAIGGLRSIAHGRPDTWLNGDPVQVARRALIDCGGEKYE